MTLQELTELKARRETGVLIDRLKWAEILDWAIELTKHHEGSDGQGPIKWTYGPNVWKDWCTQYFGPDADDTYLAEAVFNLPPMAQNFKYADKESKDE